MAGVSFQLGNFRAAIANFNPLSQGGGTPPYPLLESLLESSLYAKASRQNLEPKRLRGKILSAWDLADKKCPILLILSAKYSKITM